MEALVFLGLITAGVVGIALALKASFWILFGVALPLFWLWMLIDAVVRKQEDYPSKSANEKVLWIVLILFVHISALVYWFVVWHAARSRAAASATPHAPMPPKAMVAVPQPAGPTPPPAV